MCTGAPSKDKNKDSDNEDEDSNEDEEDEDSDDGDENENEDSDKEIWIVGNHIYSLISCKEYDGVRLLKIRNPMGFFEWGGAWSDNAPEWKQKYIDYFKPDFDTEDGTF